ncbi:MAG: chromosomal replication initiator protein DnaA [Clostridiales bacterium]|nr:chromosomal replication initiator protein DnaA [Clostridiales bacterium]
MPMNYNDAAGLWQKTLDLLHSEVEEHSYLTWFKPIRLVSVDDGLMVLEVGDRFVQQVLKARFLLLIQNAVLVSFGGEYAIEVVVRGERPGERPADAASAPPDTFLNPKYTFDTFVVGASNRFAHAASLAVAELPSDAYNPLFLYGGVGLGKTHLMHAIGHYIQRQTPSAKLMYITSENFTNQLIDAIAKKTNQEFRERLRNVDVLMVDDIQFIAGKTSTQEEFFHTFNELHGGGKQIIISSDRPPKEIPTLEERLRSRFEWGLIADIQRPDYETRIAILRNKADNERIQVDNDVLHYIAERIESNIRELEGALTRVNAKASFTRSPITLAMAEEELSKILKTGETRRIGPELIMDVVAGYYHLPVAEMTSQRRNREIAMPRQVAMFLTREMTDLSTTRIGDAFGGRDHTTVLHACDKVADMVKANARMRETVEELRTSIRRPG